ncbi:MAG: hypothetical protein WBA45_16250 [Microthrixaceae bacterium]
MSVDWDALLDELELSILEGTQFSAPPVDVPVDVQAELAPRLSALMDLCLSRISGVEAEMASTGDELAQLSASRRATQPLGQRTFSSAFNHSL